MKTLVWSLVTLFGLGLILFLITPLYSSITQEPTIQIKVSIDANNNIRIKNGEPFAKADDKGNVFDLSGNKIGKVLSNGKNPIMGGN